MTERILGVPDADVARVRDAATDPARVGVVLGSGLAGLADLVEDARAIPYAQLESIPSAPLVAGHAGSLVLGRIADLPVMLFSGRIHQYQGVSAHDAAWPSRMAAAAGCDTLVVTNASGGVAKDLAPGDIVLIADHINLTGTNPLVGWPGPPGGSPFVPMRDAYDPDLRSLAREAAAGEVVPVREGVYAGLLGPTYETPAEVAYVRRVGADVVGMSTVPEVIAARALGMRVLGLSLVTNVAAGPGLSHAEVLQAGRDAADRLTRLVIAILRKL